MRMITIPVTTTGADASATGTAYSAFPLSGVVYALYVDWGSTAPAGTSDITITSESAPSITYYSKLNSSTDAWVYPRAAVTDAAGTAVTYDGTNEIYEPFPINDRLKVVVAQCNALAPAATVYAFIEER